ncbi:MAG: hypothetical protein HZA95_01670 [Candidatus Vogelbacteria bacterium]|nr:hypothetical protein [Candidatus Vogelbacteria bacterium]
MNKKTIILVAVLVLVIVSAIYFFLGQSDSGESAALNTSGKPSLSGQVVPKDTDSVVGQKFLATLLKMQDLNLDRAILQDVVFLALKDMSRPLPEQTPGRDNPFSPLEISGVINGAGSLSSQASLIQSSNSTTQVNSLNQTATENKAKNTNSSTNNPTTKKVTKPTNPALNSSSGQNSNSNVDTGVGGGFVSP